MRIGPDVAPRWSPHPDRGGYDDTTPATVNAWRNTLVRSFMHRRLWLNDPDCLMLRTEKTHLTTDQLRAWAHAVAASGGMALVSDDLALLGPEARALLDEVVAVGRAVDGQARPPRCPDLLDAWTPTTLESPAAAFVGDPVAGRARLVVAAD
jgi:alpha-galactosidase